MVPDYQIPVTPLVEVLVRNLNIFWNINKIVKNIIVEISDFQIPIT